MNKSDLKYGNVVETGDGERYLFTYHDEENIFVNLIYGEVCYFDSLRFDNNCNNSLIAIMKVYKDYTLKDLLWERKEMPKLTDDEKAILRNIDKKYRWIARDEDEMLIIFTGKPIKKDYYWKCKDEDEDDECCLFLFAHLFQSIKWEDGETYFIEDLLKGDDENE